MTMGRQTSATALLLLAFLGLVVPVFSHDCRSITLTYEKRRSIPPYSDCSQYIDVYGMLSYINKKIEPVMTLGYERAHVCQGDDGFSNIQYGCDFPTCQGGKNCAKDCRCFVKFDANRVHKVGQWGFDCSIKNYASSLVGVDYKPGDDEPADPNQKFLATFVTAKEKNGNVHCAHQH